MITVKLYQINSEVPIELQVDSVNIGYVRKMKSNGIDVSELRATMDFIQNTSNFSIDNEKVNLLKGYFDKIEIINGDNVEEVANGRTMMCTGIISRYPANSDVSTSDIETLISFREQNKG